MLSSSPYRWVGSPVPQVTCHQGSIHLQTCLSRPTSLLNAGLVHPSASWISLQDVHGHLEPNVSKRECFLLPSVCSIWGKETSLSHSVHQPGWILCSLCLTPHSILRTPPAKSMLALLTGSPKPLPPWNCTHISFCGTAIAPDWFHSSPCPGTCHAACRVICSGM